MSSSLVDLFKQREADAKAAVDAYLNASPDAPNLARLHEAATLANEQADRALAALQACQPSASAPAQSATPVPTRPKLAFDGLAEFQKFLSEIFSTVHPISRILRFHTDILGEDQFGKTVFVRNCYNDLLNIMESSKQRGGDYRFVVTGTPGIGKSIFIAYCLLRLCPKYSVIVYHNKNYKFLIQDGQVSFIADDDASVGVLCHDILYVVDGVQPILCANCFTIFVISPRFKVYKEFIKARNTTTVLTMPPWSFEELQEANSHLQFRNDHDLIRLFEHYGGVPRYILSKRPIEEELSFLQSVIRMFSGNFDDITRAFMNEHVDKDIFKISSLLLHLVPDSEFKRSAMQWASRFVLNEVSQRHRLSLVAKVKEFIQSASRFPQFSASCGLLFEPLLHDALLTISSEIINLKDRSVRVPFRLQNYQTVIFPNILCLENIRSDYYYVPSVGNLGAGDSFAIYDDQLLVFQITVSKKHPVNGREMLKLISSISSRTDLNIGSKPVRLIFVVPFFVEPEFEQQKFTKKTFRVTEDNEYELKALNEAAYKRLPRDLKVLDNVEQFVLGIKLLEEHP